MFQTSEENPVSLHQTAQLTRELHQHAPVAESLSFDRQLLNLLKKSRYDKIVKSLLQDKNGSI